MASTTVCGEATSGATAAPSSCVRLSCAAVSSGSATATRTASPSRPSGRTRACLAKLIGIRFTSSAGLASHEDLAEPRAGLLAALRGQRLLEPLAREARRLDEDLADQPAAQPRRPVRDDRRPLGALGSPTRGRLAAEGEELRAGLARHGHCPCAGVAGGGVGSP